MKSFVVLLFTLIVSTGAWAQQCKREEVQLQVLGSGGPELDDSRSSSGYLVWHQNKAQVLIDAGAGTSVVYGTTGAKLQDLQALLLSHLHVDHSADLPAFIKGSFFTERQTDLALYGPSANDLMPATSQYLQRLLGENGAFSYLKEYVDETASADYKINAIDVPLKKDRIFTYQLSKQIVAKAIVVHHGPIAAIAWRVEVAGCSLVFSGDMSNKFDVLTGFAKNADVLVAHNAVPEGARGVARNLHMPPSDIGKIASQAGVEQLVLSHFMKRTLAVQNQSIAAIKQQFDGPITLATDAKIISL